MDVANAVKHAVKGSCGGVVGYWLYGLLNGVQDANWYYFLAVAASIFVVLFSYYCVKSRGTNKTHVVNE
ncbi:hypothetical protein JYB87_10130 [Shewanella avicenniae]|uniref:Uncharacterized protein n=1 Tax=Shewanella avicenniae TaxID=2814294 RepID=A0ABX7QML4_9GAMM|nr:hypothetical protein [Shewanella avicenniae]QSX32143.1 hypothetical protein JYB87_10130 [Shewanella avicenniae]